jgi:chromosome segregation ATPase
MTQISELVAIDKSIDDKITKALGTLDTYVDRSQEEILTLADIKQRLLEDIKELRLTKNNMQTKINDIDKMYTEIKDKHKIIVENMPKQKKHPIKEEEA